jgi:uncharacterized protein (DUF2252 family)
MEGRQSELLPMHPIKPRDERAQLGRSMRKQARRSAIADWRPSEHRADPVAILEGQNAARLAHRIPIRYGRMAASPFAFFRGAAAIMAADLATTPTSGIQVQLCGDAHLSNFGLFAAMDRRVLFDINDFDETAPGPFEWDILRLAASAAIAGSDSGFSVQQCRNAVLAALEAYGRRIREAAAASLLAVFYSRVEYETVLELAAKRAKASRKVALRAYRAAQRRTNERALAKLSAIIDGTRRIVPDPPLVVPPTPEQREVLMDMFEGFRESFRPSVRKFLERFELVDVAEKVVGVGSVGLRALILLLQTGDGDPLFLQLKQAVPSVLAPYLPPCEHTNQGQRVIEGQREIQGYGDPFLGWSSGEFQGQHVDFYCRQLHDRKGSIDPTVLGAVSLADYSRLCGATLSRAHARSGDAAVIAGYLGRSDRYAQAVAEFAIRYVDVNRKDYEALLDAIASGRVEAAVDG